ncbi:TRAP transporter substrate-binding protein [Radicibacter daui]|uniref:TRAP transporter substrate-binding protein n=1 Tax=Radicibacter daui TaxID=3064829 RepID=UPI004046EE64
MSFSRSFSRRLLAAGFGLAVALGAQGFASAEAKTVLKLGHLANEQNVWHKAALKFAEEVSKRTNGEVEVQVFPNEQLGKETDLIKGIQLGIVDFTITGETLQNWAPSAALLAVPYAIRDLDHLDHVVGGPVGEAIAKEIQDKTQLVPLTYFARGPRNLTSNRPIKTPADLNGFRMRVPNVPLFVDVWQALGASPVPMAFSEVFTALQSNTIDGQENPLALIKSASFNEVQKYVNRTEHVRSWIYLVTGERTMKKLSPEQQEAVREAAKVAHDYERPLFLADEKQLEVDLKSAGMEFVDSDQAAFAAAAKAAVLKSLKPEILPLYNQILDTK